MRLSEALGIVMMDYGNDAGGTLGELYLVRNAVCANLQAKV